MVKNQKKQKKQQQQQQQQQQQKTKTKTKTKNMPFTVSQLFLQYFPSISYQQYKRGVDLHN